MCTSYCLSLLTISLILHRYSALDVRWWTQDNGLWVGILEDIGALDVCLYLDLIPHVRFGTSFHQLEQCIAISISARSSLNVLRQLLVGNPLFLLTPWCTHSIATCTSRSLDNRSVSPASLHRWHKTMSCRRSTPALLVASSLVTWCLPEMPDI